jgi:putative hydrolase of the HAD superfamily
MSQYHHYSFDLWDTLIKSNEYYKKRRAYHLHYHIKKLGVTVTIEQIEETIKEVWRYYDMLSKFNGRAPDAFDMYAMVIFRLTGSLKGISQLEMQLLYKELERIFFDYPPSLYDEDTKGVLEELQSRGKTLSILSNTSYIRGSTLDIVLEQLGIKERFLFRLYSDKIEWSKPSNGAYMALEEAVISHGGGMDTTLHIGDDVINDGEGAKEYGFNFKIINSNQLTIKDLL